MITQAMKDNITAVVKKNMDAANQYYGKNWPMPKITYNLRGRVAGCAKIHDWHIQLNAVLLTENIDEMTNETTPHEIAHLIDFKVNPENFEHRYNTGRKRSIHGPTFKFILGQVLGCHNTSTTHNMDTSTSSTKRRGARHVWISTVDGSEMVLGPKRHRTMASGFGRYWMRGCSHHTYTYSHVQGETPTEFKVAANNVKPKVTEVTITKPTKSTSHIRLRPPIVPTTGTKKERAKIIFTEVTQGIDPRKRFIAICIDDLNMTKAGASTYYSNFNNGKW